MEFKPCPFCGNEVEIFQNKDMLWGIKCTGFDCRMSIIYSNKIKEDAIKYWNEEDS